MRGRFAWVLGLGLGMTLVSAAPPVHADPPGPNALPIHIISVKTDSADAQADALTTALKAELRKVPGWSLKAGDYSLEVLLLALRCPSPPDAACEVRIAGEIKSQRFIWGTLDESQDDKVTGTLRMWSKDSGQTKADLSFSKNLTEPNDEALREVARDALMTLTGGPPKGQVKLSAGDASGQILVDGEPSGSLRKGTATIFVPAGEHTIEVRAPGYAPASGTVTVKPNGEVSLDLELETEEEAKESGGSMSVRRIAGYGALVAGGALGAVGLYSTLKINSMNNSSEFQDFVSTIPDDQDPCDAANAQSTELAIKAQDTCSSGDTLEPLQYVFYGLGAVAVGAGVYLLVTDDSTDEERGTQTGLRILPMAGPNAGGLDLRLTF